MDMLYKRMQLLHLITTIENLMFGKVKDLMPLVANNSSYSAQCCGRWYSRFFNGELRFLPDGLQLLKFADSAFYALVVKIANNGY